MYKIRLCLWSKDCELIAEKTIREMIFSVNVGDYCTFKLSNGETIKGLFDSINILPDSILVDCVLKG